MPTTQENLLDAFSGESQANQKYRAFAKKAERDGFPNIAKLFRTTAEAERIHAEGHLLAMDKVGSTMDNLKAAINGEQYEFTEMYPPMLKKAEEEGHKAKRIFKFAVEAEKVHAALYTKALEAIKSGKDLSEVNFFLCPICGHIEVGKAPERCPICNARESAYVQI